MRTNLLFLSNGRQRSTEYENNNKRGRHTQEKSSKHICLSTEKLKLQLRAGQTILMTTINIIKYLTCFFCGESVAA